MTFGSLWAPEPQYPDRYPETYVGDRGDNGAFTYDRTAPAWNGNKKAEKKQAAMSALTLIAFLFFLNILQNCLKEHTASSPITTMLLTRAPPTIFQGREPEDQTPEVKKVENENDKVQGFASRKLLSTEEDNIEKNGNQRVGKFIHNLHASRDWTNDLSQVSDDELQSQKQKLDQLRKLWNKRKSTNYDDEERQVKFKKKVPPLQSEVNKVKKFMNSPVLSDTKVIPKLSEFWRFRRTTTYPPETKTMLFEQPEKKVADFNEFEILSAKKDHLLLEPDNVLLQDAAQSLQLRADPIGAAEEVVDEIQTEDSLNTPRYRRSDELLTTLPTELFRAETTQMVTPSTPTAQVASSTARTYHVYTKPSQIFSNMWKLTTTPPTPSKHKETEDTNINDIYFTTAVPTKRPNPNRRYSNHRPQYKPATRYRTPPNRRTSFEPPLVRHEYYPMSVVGQYGGSEESSIVGVFQLLWTLMSSFAQPISRFLPQMTNLGRNGQCLDLLACEAQRVGTFMGPTASAFASSFTTLLSWVTPENQRKIVEEAIAAGREDTCMKQIKLCDDKSGGKSAMTMFAQLLEFRQRNDRLPRF